jgi:hypothetical protein
VVFAGSIEGLPSILKSQKSSNKSKQKPPPPQTDSNKDRTKTNHQLNEYIFIAFEKLEIKINIMMH